MPDATGREWRVSWKRMGLRPKHKRYARESAARRFLGLLGPEPWRFFSEAPDSYRCCRGDPEECGCGGETWREWSDAIREEMPALEYARIEFRVIGPWQPEPSAPRAGNAAQAAGGSNDH